MGVITLRPDGISAVSGWFNTTSGSMITQVADNSDTTSIHSAPPKNGTTTLIPTPYIVYNFNTFTLPPSAYIRSITPRIRHSSTKMSYALRSSRAGSPFASSSSISIPSNHSTFTSSTNAAGPPASAYTTFVGGKSAAIRASVQAELDSIQLYISQSPSAGRSDDPAVPYAYQAFVAELYLDIDYNEAPVVSSVVANNTTLTTKPTVSWAYTDPEGDAQKLYQVKVFPTAITTAAGFNPETTTAFWSSGAVASQDQSVLIGSDLTVGTSYTAYVKAADAGSGDRYGTWASSAAFTVNIIAALAPTISAVTMDASNNRVGISVLNTNNLMTTDQAALDVSITGSGSNSSSTDGVTASLNTALTYSGLGSMKIVPKATGDANFWSQTNATGTPVVGGKAYTFRAMVYNYTTARNWSVFARWYDSAGVFISGAITTPVSVPLAAWTAISSNIVSPSNAAFAAVQMRITATVPTDIFYVDNQGIFAGSSTPWNRGGLTTNQKIQIQRTYDSGVTWESVYGADALDMVGGYADYSDYLSRPNTPVRYRARITTSDQGYDLTSPWTAVSAAALAQVNDFWLLNPKDPTQNTKISLAGDLQTSSDEAQGKFAPLGRNRAVVVAGDVYGEEFNLTVNCRNQADYDKIEALRKAQTTLLLQSDTTAMWWVRLGPQRGATLVNNVTRKSSPFRTVALTATEVDPVV